MEKAVEMESRGFSFPKITITEGALEAPSIEMAVETIGPDEARCYLKANGLNRKLSLRVVGMLAGKIQRGEWLLNGDAIAFDYYGKLLNGQHRLNAVVEAGEAIETVVIRGLDPAAFKTYDNAKKRVLADAIDIAAGGKVRDSHILQAITAYLFRHDNCGNIYSRSGWDYPSVNEAFAVMARYPTMKASLAWVRRYHHANWFLPTSMATALHLLFARVDPAGADRFLEAVRSGINIAEGSATLALRDYLIKEYTPRKTRDPRMLLAVTIKAWNRWRDGETMRTIAWRSGEHRPQIEDLKND